MLEEYRSNDIWLVASLFTYGFIYKQVVQSDGDFKKWFIYDRNKDFNIAIANYYSGQLNVPALQFKANYNQVLEIVKSKSKNESK